MNVYEPTNGFVVIEAIKPKEKTSAGGIIIPQVGPKKRGSTESGKVIYADPKLNLKGGEIVHHRPGVGLDIELDGKEYIAVRAAELAVIEKLS